MPSPFETAAENLGIGLAKAHQGQYAEAERALNIALEALPLDFSELTSVLRVNIYRNLFVCAHRTSRFTHAKELADKQLVEARLAGSSAHDVALAYNHIGLALLELGRLNEAETALRSALATLDDGRHELSSPELTSSLRNTIVHHLNLIAEARAGVSGKAVDRVDTDPAADAFWRKTQGPLAYFKNKSSLANLSIESETDCSVSTLERMVAEARQGRDPYALGVLLSNLGGAYSLDGDFHRAKATLEESIQHLSSPNAPRNSLAIAHHQLAVACMRGSDWANAATHSKLSWDIIHDCSPDAPVVLPILNMLARCRVHEQDFRRAEAIADFATEAYDRIRTHLAQSEAGHAGLFEQFREAVELAVIIAINNQDTDKVFSLVERAKARWWREVRGQTGEHGGFMVHGLRADPGSESVSLLVGTNTVTSVCSKVRASGANRAWATAQELNQLVQTFIEHIQGSSRRPLWLGSGQELADKVFGEDPLRLGGLGALAISPDGPLWSCPLDLLIAIKRGAILDGQTPSLPEIHLVPSIDTWQRFRKQTPMFTGSELKVLIAWKSAFASAPALEGAQIEATRVESIIRHARPDSRIETTKSAAATLEGFASADIIHIATHVAIDQNGNGKIILDGEVADSFITSDHIARQPLKAALVVLSNCQSAVGRMSTGEGVASLARTFLLQGCRSVVASLWPVGDTVTSRLMEELYKNLFVSGLPVAASLTSAKMQLLRDGAPLSDAVAFQVYGESGHKFDSQTVAEFIHKAAEQGRPR